MLNMLHFSNNRRQSHRQSVFDLDKCAFDGNSSSNKDSALSLDSSLGSLPSSSSLSSHEVTSYNARCLRNLKRSGVRITPEDIYELRRELQADYAAQRTTAERKRCLKEACATLIELRSELLEEPRRGDDDTSVCVIYVIDWRDSRKASPRIAKVEDAYFNKRNYMFCNWRDSRKAQPRIAKVEDAYFFEQTQIHACFGVCSLLLYNTFACANHVSTGATHEALIASRDVDNAFLLTIPSNDESMAFYVFEYQAFLCWIYSTIRFAGFTSEMERHFRDMKENHRILLSALPPRGEPFLLAVLRFSQICIEYAAMCDDEALQWCRLAYARNISRKKSSSSNTIRSTSSLSSSSSSSDVDDILARRDSERITSMLQDLRNNISEIELLMALSIGGSTAEKLVH